MSSRPFFLSLTEFAQMFGSAVNVSAAIRSHRRPRSADLKRLGIADDQFGRFEGR